MHMNLTTNVVLLVVYNYNGIFTFIRIRGREMYSIQSFHLDVFLDSIKTRFNVLVIDTRNRPFDNFHVFVHCFIIHRESKPFSYRRYTWFVFVVNRCFYHSFHIIPFLTPGHVIVSFLSK